MSGKGFGRDYPRGRVSGEDEGSTPMGIAHDPSTNTLVIRFFKPMQWIGLGPDEVLNLLMMLAKHLSVMKGVPVQVVIGDEEGDRNG
ncbi:hypothetical protein [Leptolyngbya ohadii]|uniref:hypothetical protein n=1 Tax=Leptolyngbya ohadii TaxID=1962290 RepID=UPI001179FFC1|nr:hypothetical protein [Leptolyngbya ohadii]